MTSTRCKAGDRAVITRCGNTRYIGALVRVEQRDESRAFDWIVTFLGAPISGRDIFTRQVGVFSRALVWDWNLTPLAEVEPESISTHEVENA